MDIKKLSSILVVAGLGLVVLSVFWWLVFYMQVVGAIGGRLSDTVQCLYSSEGVCAMISAGAQLVGKTAYSPISLWIGVASLATGALLSATSTSSTALAVDNTPHETSRKCPFCAEAVKIEAKIGRYCQKDLPALTDDETQRLLFGLCPNCKTRLPVNARECSNCKATFGAASSWTIEALSETPSSSQPPKNIDGMDLAHQSMPDQSTLSVRADGVIEAPPTSTSHVHARTFAIAATTFAIVGLTAFFVFKSFKSGPAISTAIATVSLPTQSVSSESNTNRVTVKIEKCAHGSVKPPLAWDVG